MTRDIFAARWRRRTLKGSSHPAGLARQHLVHHLAREAEIARGITHLVELGTREMLGNVGILRQQVDQRHAGRGDLAADVVDQVVSALPAGPVRTTGATPLPLNVKAPVAAACKPPRAITTASTRPLARRSGWWGATARASRLS